MPEPLIKQPNLYQLQGDGLHIAYETNSFAVPRNFNIRTPLKIKHSQAINLKSLKLRLAVLSSKATPR
jgi:hypothetical protein